MSVAPVDSFGEVKIEVMSPSFRNLMSRRWVLRRSRGKKARPEIIQ